MCSQISNFSIIIYINNIYHYIDQENKRNRYYMFLKFMNEGWSEKKIWFLSHEKSHHIYKES